jgi:hypothetical protein
MGGDVHQSPRTDDSGYSVSRYPWVAQMFPYAYRYYCIKRTIAERLQVVGVSHYVHIYAFSNV